MISLTPTCVLRATALFAVLAVAAPASLLAQTPAAPASSSPQPASPPPATAPAAQPPLASSSTAPVTPPKPKKTKKVKAADAAASSPAPAPAAAGAPVFPSAVNAKYASQTAGEARMHTCLDQYHANKTANGNGGLKWIQKGGGYYSQCSKKLKG